MAVDDAAIALNTVLETDAATVGGLVTAALGHLPLVGETVRIGDFEFAIEQVAEKAVETVIARRVRTDDEAVEAS
jgi:Mg2+/Co2+ transporter CorC